MAWDVRIGGRVQGVGYRPFVQRLALSRGIRGWVRNAGGQVLIHAEGQRALLDGFVNAMVAEAPPLAVPEPPVIREADFLDLLDFKILDSLAGAKGPKVIPPDHFVCA
ncbi:MAG: carbamoyltransferase HypF, partial [Methylococcus sp.]